MGRGASGILDYLLKLHAASALEVSTSGSIVGGVRGITGRARRSSANTEEITWPNDSVKLLSNTVTLQWPKANQAYGSKIILINQQSGDTVYNHAAPPEGKVTVNLEKEGTYKWQLYSKLQKDKNIKRVIIKPGEKETTTLTDALNRFKSQLDVFDEETASLILDDYFYKNNIAEN